MAWPGWPSSMRPEAVTALDGFWHDALPATGTFFTAGERIAIVDEARAAQGCAFTHRLRRRPRFTTRIYNSAQYAIAY